MYCDVIYLFEDNKLEYLTINVSFYSFTVVHSLPNNNKCTCTYFNCGLENAQEVSAVAAAAVAAGLSGSSQIIW